MREIKFKCYALDDDFGKHTDCIVNEDVYIMPDGINCDGDVFELNDKDCFLAQYTGLKDKNGKEIYEGDIIKSKDCFYTTVVEFTLAYASFVLVNRNNKINNMALFGHRCEVIGNIYENPELLNKEANNE